MQIESIPPTSRVRTIRLLIFLILFLSYAWFIHHSRGWNENSRLALAAAISRDLSFRIDEYVEGGEEVPQRGKPVARYQTGDVARVPHQTPQGIEYRLYSDKAPGSALLASIPYAMLHHGFGITDHAALRYGSLLFTVSAPSALFGLVMFSFFQWLRPGNVAGNAALTLAYGLGTLAFPYSTLLLGHQLAAIVGFSAFYVLMRSKENQPRPEAVFWAGFLLSLTTLFEYTAGIVLVVVGLYGVWILRRRPALVAIFVLGTLPGFSFQAFYNTLCFGGPLRTGYPYHLKYGAEMAKGFMGSDWPTWERFAGTLFLSKRGLLYEMPVLALCVVGLWFAWRRRQRREELVACIVVVLAFILLNSSFRYWDGVGALGVRHVIPTLPFLFVGAAYLNHRWTAAFNGLALVSVLFMLAGTAADPRVELKVENALFGFSFPLLMAGYGSRCVGDMLPNFVSEFLRAGDFLAARPWLISALRLLPLVVLVRLLGRRLERLTGAVPWHGAGKVAVWTAVLCIGFFVILTSTARIDRAQRYCDFGEAVGWADDKHAEVQPELVLASFEKAVELRPDYALFRYELGRFYWRYGYIDKALEAAIEAAKLDSEYWSLAAKVHYALGETLEARSALNRYAQEHLPQLEIVEFLDHFDPDWSPPAWTSTAAPSESKTL